MPNIRSISDLKNNTNEILKLCHNTKEPIFIKYEDNVERMALRQFVSGISGTCLEIGAGYGRLVNVYARFCSDVLPSVFLMARIIIN